MLICLFHGHRHLGRWYKIIKSLGIDMVKLEKYQFSAEVVASGSMIAATLSVSPEHTNTKATAMMGAGASRSIKDVN
jgi:PiT family inorganic phosphate transporter